VILEAPLSKQRRMISITPLIDVVFILLLFFMLSSTFSRMKQIELKTVQSSSASAQESVSEKLVLTAREQVVYQNKTYALASPAFNAVLADLAAQQAKLVVAAWPDVPVQNLILLVDQAHQANIADVNIAQSVKP